MNEIVTVTIESEDDDVPESKFIQSVISQACLIFGHPGAEVNVQVVDESAMTGLNGQYRGKQGPTNVLSFTSDLPQWVDSPLIGDIVLCPAIIRHEARQFNKPLDSRWAHMLVHGTLHLLGMSHDDERQRSGMESMESRIMSELGYENPYLMTA